MPSKKAENAVLLVDTNIFVYATGVPEREKHAPTRTLEEACRQIVSAIGEGEVRAVTHLAVLQEIVYLFGRWARERRAPELHDYGKKAAESALALVEEVLITSVAEFRLALHEFDPRSDDFNDRLIIAGMKVYGIEHILTADRSFARDERIKVLDPIVYAQQI